MSKAIIIGASTAGKTTVIAYLHKHHPGLPLKEMDEEIKLVHNGDFPGEEEWKDLHGITVPPIKKRIIESTEPIVFFTNSNYFTVEELQRAKQDGFKIILITVDRKTMESRNAYRVKHEGYDDLSKYFDKLDRAIQDVIDAGVPDDVIDGARPIQDVADRIYKNLITK